MSEPSLLTYRAAAIVCVLLAAGLAAAVVSQALTFDDGGPPMGALCMAAPSFGLILLAGLLWSDPKKGRGDDR